MKSIKPGRGPSKLGAAGSIFAACFGVFWCIMAGAMGAWFMIPFGLLFVGFAIYSAVYNHRNATADNRYSLIDIVDSEEEPDPLNMQKNRCDDPVRQDAPGTSASFCPFCGAPVAGEFDFCPKCGKKLPDC